VPTSIVDALGKMLLKIFKVPESSVGFYEKKILHAVSPEAKILIDVGARTDMFFPSLSKKFTKVYLIEGSKYFAFFLRIKILFSKSKDRTSVINAFVSSQDLEYTNYFPLSQSMFQNMLLPEDKPLLLKVPQMRLDTFLVQQNIELIDFIKFDIEGGDYFGLLSLGHYLNKCKYIQFELGIEKSWKDSGSTLEMYLALLEPHYNLYLVRDINNPFFDSVQHSVDLIKLDEKVRIEIKKFQDRYIGFNCFGTSKNLRQALPKGLIPNSL
jgi:FkbM family methyltransferase